MNKKSVNFNSGGSLSSQPKLNLQSLIDEDEQVPGHGGIDGILNRIKYSKFRPHLSSFVFRFSHVDGIIL